MYYIFITYYVNKEDASNSNNGFKQGYEATGHSKKLSGKKRKNFLKKIS